MEVPFSSANLFLKQLNLAELNELGRLAVDHAFSGFDSKPDAAEVEKWTSNKATLAKQMGYTWIYDPTRFRRYAGDRALPRARYHTIAADDSGFDNKTLIGELREYYDPKKAGLIQIYDSTNPEDLSAIERRIVLTGPHLVLYFLPLRNRPNPFTEQHTDRSRAGTIVLLPLKVTRVQCDKIIDLRLPSTGDWFAYNLSRLEWDTVSGTKIKCFVHRSPLDSFRELLPALLEQSRGGSEFTNLIGNWLRRIGAQGLVYPSARADARVDMRNDAVVSSEGFCFVDYSQASPLGFYMLDEVEQWPKYVQVTPDAPGDFSTPIQYQNVRFHYDEHGPAKGSWRVENLRNMRSLLWRLNGLGAMIDQLCGSAAADIKGELTGWLVFEGMRMEVADAICLLLQEALFGIKEKLPVLDRLIGDSGLHAGNAGVVGALRQIKQVAEA